MKTTCIYAKLVKEAVKGEVIVFGSVLEGKHTMASDIDLLVVLDSIERRDEILMKINEVLGEFHPFQIHLVTGKEFEWYKMFIKKWKCVNNSSAKLALRMIRGRELREEVGEIITIKKKRFFFYYGIVERREEFEKAYELKRGKK